MKQLTSENVKQFAHLSGLLNLIHTGAISGNQGKDVFLKMFESGKSPQVLIKETDIKQVFGFFVGQVMKENNGQANPTMTSTII